MLDLEFFKIIFIALFSACFVVVVFFGTIKNIFNDFYCKLDEIEKKLNKK